MKLVHITYALLYTIFSCTPKPTTSETKHKTLKVIDSIETQLAVVSLKTIQIEGRNYVYIAGEGNDLIAYEIINNKLIHKKNYTINSIFGGVRAINHLIIDKEHFMIVGNKAENGLELFKINKNGEIQFISRYIDTDITYLKEPITTEIVTILNNHYVYVGGLDIGISCFKITKKGFTHLQSIKDTKSMHLDGIIGMRSINIDNNHFLFVGGFFDDGVSAFKIALDGTLKNTSNIHNSDDVFLTGAFSVDVVQFDKTNYLLVSHRHKSHYSDYKNNEGVKYNGDGLNIFKINHLGNLKPHQIIADTDTIRLKGNTRIEHVKKNKNEALIIVATREDRGIQLFELNADGNYNFSTDLDLGFEVYNGMDTLLIDNVLYIVTSGYDQYQLKLIKVQSK